MVREFPQEGVDKVDAAECPSYHWPDAFAVRELDLSVCAYVREDLCVA